jgi:hypothetical protein
MTLSAFGSVLWGYTELICIVNSLEWFARYVLFQDFYYIFIFLDCKMEYNFIEK